MRMEIVGKIRRQGTSSKTGKPFDFVELHCIAPKRGVEGKSVLTVTVDSGLLDYDRMELPGEYVVDFDNTGRVLGIEQID